MLPSAGAYACDRCRTGPASRLARTRVGLYGRRGPSHHLGRVVGIDQGVAIDSGKSADRVGEPEQYGASVWDNVAFTDVYYQTRGENGANAPDQIVPAGRPIPGAYNVFLDPAGATSLIPATGQYDALNVFGDHRWVWEGFYLSTVNDDEPQTNEDNEITKDTPDGNDPITSEGTGYDYSRIIGSARPEPVFYVFNDTGAWDAGTAYNRFDQVDDGASNYYFAWIANTDNDPTAGETYWFPLPASSVAAQDHTWSSPLLVDTATGEPNMDGLFEARLEPPDVVQAQWAPQWNPMALFNGDFSNEGDTIVRNSNALPGWLYHGGTELDDDFVIELTEGDTNSATLSADASSIIHNYFYLPEETDNIYIDFDITQAHAASNDVLRVYLGDTEIDNFSLTAVTTFNENITVDDGVTPKGRGYTLTIEIDGGDDGIDTAVEVYEVDLRGYIFQAYAGDVTKIDLDSVNDVGYANLPDVAEAQELPAQDVTDDLVFATDGVFFFIPDISSDGFQVDFTQSYTYTIEIDGTDTDVRIEVVDGYSDIELAGSVGGTANATAADNNDVDVYSVQQRLKYLNYRGVDPNPEVTLDGSGIGDEFLEALRLKCEIAKLLGTTADDDADVSARRWNHASRSGRT